MYGWEPAEHTTYRYDDAGRLIGSTTVREPEFTPNEVAILLASREKEQGIGPHGFPMSVATDPEVKGQIQTHMAVDFIAQKLEQTREQYKKDYGHQDQSGFVFYATLD